MKKYKNLYTDYCNEYIRKNIILIARSLRNVVLITIFKYDLQIPNYVLCTIEHK